MKEMLIKKLYEIQNNKDFVLAVVGPLDEEFEMKQVLDYIEINKEATPSQLVLLAMSIDKDRRKVFS